MTIEITFDDGSKLELMRGQCDRCGKEYDGEDLGMWKLTEEITYRRRSIRWPILCRSCFMQHKELAWRRGYA